MSLQLEITVCNDHLDLKISSDNNNEITPGFKPFIIMIVIVRNYIIIAGDKRSPQY